MTRIFVVLAALETVALVSAYLVGALSKLRLMPHSYDASSSMLHFLLGLFSAIGCLLVHCLIFTYFLGTGRWVKEVGLAYELPDVPYPRLTRELKRRTFPPALSAMLVSIAAVASGAGQRTDVWPWFVHGLLATATLIVNVWAFVIEYRNVRINAGVLEAVLIEVDRIRLDRGLPPNAEALRE